MLSAAAAFIPWECIVWVYLAFEALEEGFTGWASSGTAVVGSCP
jgi:hypothetical protein